MTAYFTGYEPARLHSEMVKQQSLLAAQASYIASGVGVLANFNTLVAAILAAETNHYDRLAAAGAAFGIGNSAVVRGNSQAAHAQTWLTTGSNSG